MRPSKRTFLWWWCGGIAAFAVAIYFHLPLIIESVPGGIVDHQKAPDAATVNAIQGSWDSEGLIDASALAMIIDLIFIGIYGVGCVLGGLYYRARASHGLKALGWVALVSGLVFLFTDYGETIAQLIQLMRLQGDDGLAWFASTLRPFKNASFIAAFSALVAALIVEWKSTGDA
ncbi:hypothetical protein [Erythrobacter sp. THAF29]|uniref:hypothetical protein n=1 Tax=Erythrobacter sp. THAF29 TaxID=2587851 RepID=UPI0012693452|nr:hypothetical protein [Erythrobacter sp. THAF29]QFT78135.1 hypothetical protein FIU90_11350 [Erythrobacter sp. THAF29]